MTGQRNRYDNTIVTGRGAMEHFKNAWKIMDREKQMRENRRDLLIEKGFGVLQHFRIK